MSAEIFITNIYIKQIKESVGDDKGLRNIKPLINFSLKLEKAIGK